MGAINLIKALRGKKRLKAILINENLISDSGIQELKVAKISQGLGSTSIYRSWSRSTLAFYPCWVLWRTTKKKATHRTVWEN